MKHPAYQCIELIVFKVSVCGLDQVNCLEDTPLGMTDDMTETAFYHAVEFVFHAHRICLPH